MTNNKNRCVITGLGVISAIGNNVEECFTSALNSVCGIKETHTVDTENCYANLAAEVHYDDLDKIPNTENLDRVSKLCIKATLEALEDSKLEIKENDKNVSVIMGSCVGGAVSIDHYYRNNKDKNDVAKMPISAIASSVASYINAGGVVTNIANACAAGTISIAYACDLIRSGKADVVLAGGTDAFASVPYAGFLALHALDSNPCSPFNHCTGITLGEGSGVVVVDSYEHAKARGAKIYGEIVGYGASCDAHHITAPDPTGAGAAGCMKMAIEDAGIKITDVDYINAHGTSTHLNDAGETKAIKTVFGDHAYKLMVSSTKSMTGHLMGAAAAIEAIFTTMALKEGFVPATINYKTPDPECDLDIVPNEGRNADIKYALSNSLGFGGHNAAVLFKKYED